MMKHASHKAFTLVETLVAVTIVALAIAGPLVAASRALDSAAVASSQITASYLAQEGVEYVRLMRDQAYLETRVSAAAWSQFLTGSAPDSITQCRTSTCSLDPTQKMGTGSGKALLPCSGNACAPLSLLSNGVYAEQTQTGATLTGFRRTIQVVDLAGTSDTPTPYPEKRVVSTVWWTLHGTPYSITVTDNLTAWQ